MKVAVIAPSFPPVLGGIQFFAQALAQDLGSHGFDVEVWTENQMALGSPYYKILANPVSSRKELLLSWGKKIYQERPENMIFVDPGSCSELILWARLCGVKTLSYWHGKEFVHSGGWRKKIQSLAAGKTSHLFCNSQYTRKILSEDTAGSAFSKADVIYPWTTSMKKSGTKKFFSSPKRLISWGRWEERKGANFLVELAARVSIPIVVMGSGPDVDVLKKSKKVEWVPAMPLDQFVQEGDWAIFPFKKVPRDLEGFGLVVAEAWCKGIPAFTTKHCGIAEVLDSDFIFDDQDFLKLMQAIEKGISEEKLSHQRDRLEKLPLDSLQSWIGILKGAL